MSYYLTKNIVLRTSDEENSGQLDRMPNEKMPCYFSPAIPCARDKSVNFMYI